MDYYRHFPESSFHPLPYYHYAKSCSNCGSYDHFRGVCPKPPQCHVCGSYQHGKKECPHIDKNCDICGKTGHLRAKCKFRYDMVLPPPPMPCYEPPMFFRPPYYSERKYDKKDKYDYEKMYRNRMTDPRERMNESVNQRDHIARERGAHYRRRSHSKRDDELKNSRKEYNYNERKRENVDFRKNMVGLNYARKGYGRRDDPSEFGRQPEYRKRDPRGMDYGKNEYHRMEYKGTNHRSKEDDFSSLNICDNCGRDGHLRMDCDLLSPRCRTCGSLDHNKMDCPR